MENPYYKKPWLMYPAPSQGQVASPPKVAEDAQKGPYYKKPWLMYPVPKEEAALTEEQAPPVQQEVAKKKYSLSEVPGAALKNLIPSAGQFLSGAANAVMHPLDTASSVFDVAAGTLRNSLPKKVVDIMDKFETNPAAAQRASQAASALGGVYKERYGSAEKIKRSLAEDPIGSIADLSTALGGAGAIAEIGGLGKTAAAIGKASAATNPLTMPTMAAASAIGSARGAVGKAAKATMEHFDPKSRAYLNAAGGQEKELVNQLRKQNIVVPGSVPTAAQAAAPLNNASFSGLGKFAASTAPNEYYKRATQQKSAQIQHLRDVGGTAEDLAKNQSANAAKSKALYSNATENTSIPIKEGQNFAPEFDELMKYPAIKESFDKAEKIAANKGEKLFKNDPANPDRMVLTGKGAHTVKLALDDAIEPSPGSAIGKNEANAMRSAKNKYLEWVEKHVPEYKVARETTAELHKPTNAQMVVQHLENKLTPPLGEETNKLRGTGYGKALKDEKGTLKEVLGKGRYDKLSEVLDKKQMSAVNDVRKDLARGEANLKLQTASSGSTPNSIAPKKGGMEIPPVSVHGAIWKLGEYILQKAKGDITEKAAREIAEEMLYPRKAAASLEEAAKKRRRRSEATERRSTRYKQVTNSLGRDVTKANSLLKGDTENNTD